MPLIRTFLSLLLTHTRTHTHTHTFYLFLLFSLSLVSSMVDIACAPQGGSFVTSVKNDRNEGALYSWNMKTMRRDVPTHTHSHTLSRAATTFKHRHTQGHSHNSHSHTLHQAHVLKRSLSHTAPLSVLKNNRSILIFFLSQSELKIGGKPINSVRYNHNGSMLVAGGSDGAIRVYGSTPLYSTPLNTRYSHYYFSWQICGRHRAL